MSITDDVLVHGYEVCQESLIIDLLKLRRNGEELTYDELKKYFIDVKFREEYPKNKKGEVLSVLFNNPFFLYEIDFLQQEIYDKLPLLMLLRHDAMTEELRFDLEDGNIDLDEYATQIRILNYYFFCINSTARDMYKSIMTIDGQRKALSM